jgi:LPS-assembly protein
MLRLVAVVACLACCGGSVRAQQSTVTTLQSHAADQVVAKQVSPDKASPLLLQADDLVYDNRANRVIARGNVEIYYNDNVLLADEVIYDKSVNTLTAMGNVRLKDSDGSVVNAERLTLSADFRDGFIRSLRALTQDDTRVAASNAYRKGDKTIFENGVVTACKPCEAHPERPPIWRIKSERVIDDKTDQNVYYENSIFEVFGVPVAWIPWFYTPDPSVQQRSGFLAPAYGSNSSLGYLVGIPYYWAISPNYDLTLTPEFTTQAGYLMQADWRQRLWNGAYEVKLAGAFNDQAQDFFGDRNWRGSVETKGSFALNSRWTVGWNAILESDQTFRRFYLIDDIYATERVSSVFLTGMADRNYFNMTVAQYGNLTGANVYDYETNTYQKSVTATSYPVIDYNYIHNKPVFGGELSFDLNALALSVNDPATATSPVTRGTMDHIVTQAEWRRTLTDDMGERFTPFVLGRADLYNVSNFQDIDGVSGSADTFTRQMIGVGLDYRYPFVAHTESASHVIEPVVQIIARGGGSNSNVPNEDSQSLVFDDTLLFDINKFSGYDRIENDTRTNFGLQYTYQNYNGVSVRAIGGESVHLAGTNPYDPTTGLGTDASDYVFGGYVDYMNRFRFLAQFRINEQDYALSSQNYSLQTKLGFFQGALSYVSVAAQPQLGFPNSRDEIAGFSAIKLNDEWTVFGDLRYDIELDQWVRNSAGIQYADECFILSVTYQQTYISYLDLVPSTSVLVRVGIKGFGQQTTPSSIGDLSPEAAVFR